MSAEPRRPLERLAYAAMVLLTLSPVVVQGLYRPLAQVVHATVNSAGVTLSALGISLVATIVCAVTWGRTSNRLPAVAAAIAALPLGAGVGQGAAGVGVATAALLCVAAFAGWLAPWLVRSLPEDLDGLAARRVGIAALMIVLGLATVAVSTRLSVFMGDSSRADLSVMPGEAFLVKHSCLSAYVQGARLATDGVENLYEMERWPHLSDSALAFASAEPYAPFGLDSYAYPPPFLLLPRLLLTPLSDFASARALWFSLSGLAFAAGLWTMAGWIGGRIRTRALMLAPLVWSNLAVLITLQTGNAHAALVVAVMMALVAFETRRPAVGGALLAFATLSKISPGLLIVLLLLQRRFREVAWTAVFGLAFTLLGLAVFGTAPYHAFLTYELPGLSSGEAMTFLAWPESVAINLAPFGLPFRLAQLGLNLGDPWALGRLFNQVYTVALLGLTVLAARVGGGPAAKARVWAALLTLASLRSPLAPGYVLIPLLWLLSLEVARARGLRPVALPAMIWVLLVIPLVGDSTAVRILLLAQQALAVGAAMMYLVRRERPEPGAA